MKGFELRAGSVIGQEHIFRQTNCQDKYNCGEIIAAGHRYWLGVVCDGCSSGPQSEVGAALLAEFSVREIARMLEAGWTVAQIPAELYGRLLAFLQKLGHLVLGEAPSKAEMARFTGTYLLATVLGFIVGEDTTVIFAAGDGLIIANDQVLVRDEANAPRYPAYKLVDPAFLERNAGARTEFEVISLDTPEVERLAIWTDGFNPALAGQIWNLGGPRSLQRKLNVWAKQKLFGDDTTGITLTRMK
jgi:hypothetical protein